MTTKVDTEALSISYSVASGEIRHLAGKIFTLLDAVIIGDTQNKAIKDTVRGFIAESYSNLSEVAFGPFEQPEMTDEEVAKLEGVSLEEAIGV